MSSVFKLTLNRLPARLKSINMTSLKHIESNQNVSNRVLSPSFPNDRKTITSTRETNSCQSLCMQRIIVPPLAASSAKDLNPVHDHATTYHTCTHNHTRSPSTIINFPQSESSSVDPLFYFSGFEEGHIMSGSCFAAFTDSSYEVNLK